MSERPKDCPFSEADWETLTRKLAKDVRLIMSLPPAQSPLVQAWRDLIVLAQAQNRPAWGVALSAALSIVMTGNKADADLVYMLGRLAMDCVPPHSDLRN